MGSRRAHDTCKSGAPGGPSFFPFLLGRGFGMDILFVSHLCSLFSALCSLFSLARTHASTEPSPESLLLAPVSQSRQASYLSAMKQDQDAASISGESKSMSMSTDWTDAKHSLYLDSMEVSFVHQLYTNNNLIASSPEKKEQSKAASSSSSKPFGRQFKVLRDGHWGRIDFERNSNWKRLPEEDDDGAVLLLMNPWIRHFRSGRRCQTSADDASISSATAIKGKPEEEPSSSSSSHLADNNTEEMTDQNFVDEDHEEMVKAKRVRTWAIAAPRKDK